ncbi:MAG: hypothetical protein L3J71_12765 [Victivallaceae bacterium]|nr:hypothetical protein [Victivallaceae bacterium]
MAWGSFHCSSVATPVVSDKLKLSFNSKYQIGARYRCDLTAELFKLTRIRSTADSSNHRRSLKIKLTGIMVITGVDVGGMIAECDFKVEKFSGLIDNQAIKSNLKGKQLSIIFNHGKRAQFRIKGDKYVALSNREKVLLSLLFPSIFEENLTELLGKKRQAVIGVSWQPPAEKFFALFKQHGIKFSQDKVKLRAEISGRETVNNIECLVIEEHVKTLNIPGFKFNFNIKVWFPVKNPSDNALRIQRQAVWNASATLPGNSSLATGHTISTTVVNSLDFILIPL